MHVLSGTDLWKARVSETAHLPKPLIAVRITAASTAFSTTRPTMIRQVRQTTVETLLGLSSHLQVEMWVGMRSVVSSCLLSQQENQIMAFVPGDHSPLLHRLLSVGL